MFHDTTKHLLKFSVISFQNVSSALFCSLCLLGGVCWQVRYGLGGSEVHENKTISFVWKVAKR